ncbi:MAG: hypothetical protein ACKN9T_10760 [Candidatus Methylumidiphilus sp.]
MSAPPIHIFKPLLLALLSTAAAADGLDAEKSARWRGGKLFQTTLWLHPLRLSASDTIRVSPISDSAGDPVILQFSAPQGGSLSQELKAPGGYNIKKILLCSNRNRPMAGVQVQLAQSLAGDYAVPLAYAGMAGPAPGCAVYAADSGQDDWGRPGQAVDARTFKTLRILLPAAAAGEIEAVGLRLQASAPAVRNLSFPQPPARLGARTAGAETAGDYLPAALDDVSNVYFKPAGQSADTEPGSATGR